MQLKILLLLFLTTSSFSFAFSQTTNTNFSDSIEFNRLIKLADKIQYSNPDSAKFLTDKASLLAEESGKISFQIRCHILYGGIHLSKGEHPKALDSFNKSLQLAREVDNGYFISYSEMAVSSVYLFLANYTLAEEHLINALEYFESNNLHNGTAGVYLNLTFIKLEQKDFSQGEEYAEKALEHYTLLNDSIGLARAYINLADIQYAQKNYDASLETARTALYYNELSGQLSMNSLAYMNIGNIFLEKNIYDSAEYYFNRSLSNTSTWENGYVTSRNKQSLARLFKKQGKINLALKNAHEAFEEAEEENLAQVKAEAAGLIADLYSQTGDFKNAFHFKSLENTIKDSLFTKEKYKVQNELETVYETSKKEKTIENLAKEKEIEVLKNKQSKVYIVILLGSILLISVSGVFALMYFRLNSRQKHMEVEQRLLRSQMNPHFIFNAISCIQEFILDNKPLEAGAYLSDFAKLMRSILNNSATEFITLDEEIDTLKHYLELQKLRFQNKLDYEIIVDPELETDEVAIPPMLSQPFIENAIIHGIANKTTGVGTVKVEFNLNSKILILNIIDDGVGYGSLKKSPKHKSMAKIITENRLSNLRKKYKNKIEFSILKTKNERNEPSGTKVTFKLPAVYIDEMK